MDLVLSGTRLKDGGNGRFSTMGGSWPPSSWHGDYDNNLLLLLRHEVLRCDDFAITELQHGHRGRLLTSAPINRRRMVAIEFGM